MAEIEKFMNIAIGDIEKIMNIETGDIEKLMTIEVPASGALWLGDRAMAYGGDTGSGDPSQTAKVEYLSIAAFTSGSWADHTEMGTGREEHACVSSGTRGINAGGIRVVSSSGTRYDSIEYVTISTPTGQTSDFGDLTVVRTRIAGLTNGILGLFPGGGSDYDNDIEQITIASAGDASDVGDLAESDASGSAASNATRGLYKYNLYNWAANNVIEYITISSPSSTTDFGDLTDNRVPDCLEDSTRVWFMGGYSNGSTSAAIDYVTVASTANAGDWGDLNEAKHSGSGTSSNAGRGVYLKGKISSTFKKDSSYFSLASTGDATDSDVDAQYDGANLDALSGN